MRAVGEGVTNEPTRAPQLLGGRSACSRTVVLVVTLYIKKACRPGQPNLWCAHDLRFVMSPM